MTHAEIFSAIAKVTAYIAVICSAFFGMKFALQGLRQDHEKTTKQVERIEEKVDDIGSTLMTIKENAARHDQRAEDIQQRVIGIEGRVTYLERKP